MDPKKKIDLFLPKLRHTMDEIEKIYKIIKVIPDAELQKYYAKQCEPIITEFEGLSIELKRMLEEYFIWEDQHKLPANLSYHKIYKNLLRK